MGHFSIFTIILCVTCPPNKETTVPRAVNAGVAATNFLPDIVTPANSMRETFEILELLRK